MNLIIYHFISGQAFFSGTVLVAVAAAAFFFSPSGARRIVGRLAALVGVLLAALSSTPLPGAFFKVWAAVVLAWLVVEWLWNSKPKRLLAMRALVMVLCVVGICIELPWHFVPGSPEGTFDTVFVVGDSLSAGIGEEKETWPVILQERTGARVENLSLGGETVGSALAGADRLSGKEGLVILEIGGNDVLRRTPIEEFERGMAELLRKVATPARPAIMLEIPLPPFHARFGAAQRRLARRHGVPLVPKRILAAVLCGPNMTVDGLHFSDAGHEALARRLAQALGPSLRPAAGGP